MPDNTTSPPETGNASFRFGLNAAANEPDTFHLCLHIGNTWYETNAVFGDHLRASEFVRGLNNAVITGQDPVTQDEHIAFAFNTLYEQTHDSHRLIIHLKDSVILTGYLIDTDTVSPDRFCHAMNRQTQLNETEQHDLIINSIIIQPDINTPVSLH